MKHFDNMLARSERGDEIIYHRGHHCLAGPDFVKRNEQACAAWQAYVRGDVLLYQRRIGPFEMEYCAKVIA